ncbi:ABC transporter ATP-binding protein [Luedemannella helvata]|uniref:ABC transporter ATP-binding protein n=1 Tax=Luedemannella helvata TaxID=349315 RepID=A0ABN2KX18_9ACTN
MKRYLRFWLELLWLSWKRYPGQTSALIVCKLLSVVLVAITALALRDVVNAVIDHDPRTAVVAGLVAALAYCAMAHLEGLDTVIIFVLVERIGLLELQPQIDHDIAAIEGLDHLERAEFLDRVTVVRGAAWGLVFGMWVAVDSVFNMSRLAVLLVVLGAVNPWLLVLLLFAAAPLWFEQRAQRMVNAAETETAESFRLQRHLFNLATEAATSKEIRTAGAGPECARRQAEAWQDVAKVQLRARIRGARWQLAGWLLFTAAFGAGLAAVANGAVSGAGTVGDVVLAITVLINLRLAVQMTVHRTAETAGAGRLIDPYLWLRDYVAAESARRKGSQPAPDTLRDGIELDHVSFTYPGTTRPALDDVSVRLAAGSVVAVVGEYGSGKTTLVKLLMKFYQPDSGTILVDGIDLQDLDANGWRSHASVIFQDFGRFQTTFGETVGLGDLEHIDDVERIEQAVRWADAQDLVRRLPDGLDTQLGRSLGGVDLSEGQWQKAALARASMRRRPVLFALDEPTASLDPPSEHAIFKRYMTRARSLAEEAGAIVIVVSHRFSSVAGADQILVMDKGRISERGTHDELVAAGGRYAEMYGIHARAYAIA